MTNEAPSEPPDRKIVSFPALEERNHLKKQQKQAEAETRKANQKQKAKEDKWRADYRAKQAQSKIHQTRKMAQGDKEPFFNFGIIPPFTKIVLWVFILIHLAVFFGLESADRFAFFVAYGFIPDSYFSGSNFPWPLITPVLSLFIHGSWMHLIFNFVMMLMMGLFFEREFGTAKTILFFFVFGMAGNLMYLMLSPFSTMPVIGASGAISGLFAMVFLTLYSRGQMGILIQKYGPWPFIIFWAALILITGLISQDVAWQSHLGGFFAGIATFHLWKKGYIKL